jgi:hypothetical protein
MLADFTELRNMAAAALAPAGDSDPYVFADIVDALEPPALVVDQGDPWLEPGSNGLPTVGPCLYTARLTVLCIAGRLEPGPGIDVLERLETYVLDRLRADSYEWPLEEVSARSQHDLSGVTYLAATITYAVPVSVEPEPVAAVAAAGELDDQPLPIGEADG